MYRKLFGLVVAMGVLIGGVAPAYASPAVGAGTAEVQPAKGGKKKAQKKAKKVAKAAKKAAKQAKHAKKAAKATKRAHKKGKKTM
jgi:hypothetical protein